MQIDQKSADSRIFNVDPEAIKRGLAMTPFERLQWAEEMMILGWQVQERLANERAAKARKKRDEKL